MSNPWSPAASNPLARMEHLLRVQMPGAPQADISAAIEDLLQLAKGGIGTAVEAIAAPKTDDVTTRLTAAEAALTEAKAQIATLAEQLATAQATITKLVTAEPAAATNDPTVTQRLDAIDRTCIALQGSISKLEAAPAAQPAASDATDAIHKRLAALEARAPARAAAPAARPAAASA